MIHYSPSAANDAKNDSIIKSGSSKTKRQEAEIIHYLRAIAARLRGLFRDPRADRELDDEIETHLRLLAERYVRQGMSEADAARAARRQFGNVTLLKEVDHEMRGIRFIETLIQDVRFALRIYRKHPGFFVVAVLALSIGIGAAAAIFGLVNTLLVHPLPYPDADRLVQVVRRMNDGQANLSSYPRFRFIQRNSRAFESMAAYDAFGSGLTAVVGDSPNLMRSLRVSGDFFHVLAVQLSVPKTTSWR